MIRGLVRACALRGGVGVGCSMRHARSNPTFARMLSPRPPPACVGYASIAGRSSVGCPLLAAPTRAPDHASFFIHAADKSNRPGCGSRHGRARRGTKTKSSPSARPASRDGTTIKKRPSLTRALRNWSITNQRGSDVERTTLLPESSSERERKSKTEGASAGQVSITSWPLASLLTVSKIFVEFNAR